MKNGPSIPGWAAGVGIAALVVILLVVGAKFATSGGPLPDSQYPKEAFKPPAYTPPAGTYMQDGKPVSGGRPAASAPTPDSRNANPYGGYGQR